MSRPQSEAEWNLVLDVIERLYAEVRAGNWDGVRKMLHGHTKPVESSGEPAGRLKRATGLEGSEDFGLDEIVATGCDFHIERLGDGGFWFNVQAGGKDLAVWLSADRRGIISATHEWRTPTKDG